MSVIHIEHFLSLNSLLLDCWWMSVSVSNTIYIFDIYWMMFVSESNIIYILDIYWMMMWSVAVVIFFYFILFSKLILRIQNVIEIDTDEVFCTCQTTMLTSSRRKRKRKKSSVYMMPNLYMHLHVRDLLVHNFVFPIF